MNRTILILIAILALLVVSVSGVFANQVAVGQVEDDNVSMVTVPVYHDTTGRTVADLTTREKHFLAQVPAVVGSKTGNTLRDACREMILANVIHVPALPCGNFTKGDSVRYWSIYQAWTGPAKAKIPVIRGPAGANGAEGAPGADSTVPGPRGPRGFKGTPGTGINNYYFNSAPVMCGQIGGQSPYMSNSMQLMSVSLYPLSNTNISVSATGGAGGSSNVVNNNANTNVNTSANNNVINVGDGTASGTATGTGTGTSTAGSGNP